MAIAFEFDDFVFAFLSADLVFQVTPLLCLRVMPSLMLLLSPAEVAKQGIRSRIATA